jgi:hypothetical protein
MTPVLDCLLFGAGIDKAVSKFISKKINSLTSLWNGLLSSAKKIGTYEPKIASNKVIMQNIDDTSK